MPQIEHNGPKFRYSVMYKRDIPGANYNKEIIENWRQDRLVINDQPSYQQYRIKVIAVNDVGEANVSPKEVIGFSGENEPLQAPTNFTLVELQGATTAWVSWNPVPISSIRGQFKGYKIKTWTENREDAREIQVQGEATNALVNNFVPYSKNFAQVGGRTIFLVTEFLLNFVLM